VRYGSIYIRSPPEADTFTAVHSSMTMKAHTYYIIFGRPPIGGSFPLPLAAPLPPTMGDCAYGSSTRDADAVAACVDLQLAAGSISAVGL